MSKNVTPIHWHKAQTRSQSSYLLPRLFLLFLLIAFAAPFAAKAETADDQFVRIYNLIQDADTLNAGGQGAAALPKYQEAQTALQRLQRAQPSWNSTVVSFRLNYLAQKIAALSEKSPKSTADAGATSDAQSSANAPSDGAGVQVKLVQAGAEPRRVLRLHPQAGEKQSVSMTLKMTMDLKMGDMQSQAMKMPGMQMAMDATVKTVSENGDIDYDFAMGDVSVMDEPGALPQVVDAIKSSLSGLKGIAGTGKLSNRGFNKGTEMKLAADAAPQLRQMMDQMKESFSTLAAPLPEEPIGPGAKWEASMPIKSQGMTIQQSATYELVSIDGEHLVIRSTIVQHAENQKIENPSMPGVKVDLTKMSGRGTGDRTCDLGLILPSTAAIEYHSDLSMAVNMGAQKQPMAMKMDMNVKMETK